MIKNKSKFSKYKSTKTNHNSNKRIWLYGYHSVLAAIENTYRKKYRLVCTKNALSKLSNDVNKFTIAINEEANRIENNWSPLYHYINQGYYYTQLKKYYEIFPRNNIKVVLFSELTKNKNKYLKEICKFLNVNENFNFSEEKKTNVSGIPKGLLGWFIMK